MKKHTGSGMVLFDGTKSISAWNLEDTRGWVSLGGDDEVRGADLFFQRVPWLYRGTMDRAENVGSMPFAIRRGAADYDGSTDYQNKLKFLPNPGRLFRQMEQSLVMTGKAYAFKETNEFGYIAALKYCRPGSISEVRDEKSGEITGYKRKLGNQTVDCKKKQILAITVADYLTEDGAPKSSSAVAALTAAGVLYNKDRFVSSYFSRGAIKATIITVDGGTRDEAERLQTWWGDVVAGIKNAWSAVVLRMQQVKATVIGEGLESLQNNELTAEQRQDIATALGVPESRLWSSAANYATRVEDERAYYKSTIIPECKTIADAFNEQVFTDDGPYKGYKLVFLSDTLEIFQENVNDQATAASAFIDFLTKCPTEKVALETALMMGFELSDEMQAAITEMFAKKEEEAARLQAQMDAQPGQDESPAQDEEDEQPNQRPGASPQEMRTILGKWKHKALHALKLGQPASVEFTSDVIPLSLQGAIAGALEAAKTENDVKGVFNSAWMGYP